MRRLVLALLVLNFSAMFVTARKCRARPRDLPVPMTPPPVSLVRPLRGLETFSEETLRASFELDYPITSCCSASRRRTIRSSRWSSD